jgi:hypothetical protein
MQTQVIVAEQTSRNRYLRPAPLPPQEIEMTVRLELPEETAADLGITPSFEPRLPAPWEDTLHQRLFDGVHGGFASTGAALPAGGLGVYITRLRFSPPLDVATSEEDVRRLGDTLEALAAATVSSLWLGVLTLGARSLS